VPGRLSARGLRARPGPRPQGGPADAFQAAAERTLFGRSLRVLTEAMRHRRGGGGGASQRCSADGNEVRSRGLHELEGVKGRAPGNKME
jgi:hypothetical protein